MRPGMGMLLLVAALASSGVAAGQEPVPGAAAPQEPPVRTPLEVVEAQLAAFNAHDIVGLRDNVAPEFMWFAVDSDATRPELLGREAFEQSMIRYYATFPTARAEMQEPTVSGPFVAVIERVFWPDEAGGEQSQASLAVYEVRDGLIYRVWYYPAAE